MLLECTPLHINEEELPKKLGLLEEVRSGEDEGIDNAVGKGDPDDLLTNRPCYKGI